MPGIPHGQIFATEELGAFWNLDQREDGQHDEQLEDAAEHQGRVPTGRLLHSWYATPVLRRLHNRIGLSDNAGSSAEGTAAV
jgi:hypothetical protein